jgi:hypothetical protein
VNQGPARLLLDEMFAPQIAVELRRRGHDVIALVADPELRALSDAEVYAWAGDRGRRVVTENVKDFRPLVGAGTGPGVLFTSSRRFARSRRNLGPLVDALGSWLVTAAGARRPVEDWLQPDAPRPG